MLRVKHSAMPEVKLEPTKNSSSALLDESMPPRGMQDFATVADGLHTFVVGTRSPNSYLFRFSVALRQWRHATLLNWSRRGCCSAILHDESLLLLGGGKPQIAIIPVAGWGRDMPVLEVIERDVLPSGGSNFDLSMTKAAVITKSGVLFATDGLHIAVISIVDYRQQGMITLPLQPYSTSAADAGTYLLTLSACGRYIFFIAAIPNHSKPIVLAHALGADQSLIHTPVVSSSWLAVDEIEGWSSDELDTRYVTLSTVFDAHTVRPDHVDEKRERNVLVSPEKPKAPKNSVAPRAVSQRSDKLDTVSFVLLSNSTLTMIALKVFENANVTAKVSAITEVPIYYSASNPSESLPRLIPVADGSVFVVDGHRVFSGQFDQAKVGSTKWNEIDLENKAAENTTDESTSADSVPLKITMNETDENFSRLLLRIVPRDNRLTRNTVRSVIRGQSNSTAENKSSNVRIEFDREHPTDARVAIETSSTPVEATICADFSSEDDSTFIKIDWIDVHRLVNVRIEQHIRVGEERRKRYLAAKMDIAAEWDAARAERGHLGALEKRLAELHAHLEDRERALSAAEVKNNENMDDIAQRTSALEAREQELLRQRTQLERDKEVERELEAENERRRRAEREKQRQHERAMESEKKQQEKALETLQKATEAQQMQQTKLDRELARISREREQHKRDAQWAKEKEQLWAIERHNLEKAAQQLKDELSSAYSTIDQLSIELKTQKATEQALKDDNAKLNRTVDFYEGRMPSEGDAEWLKRREIISKSMESAIKGKWAAPGITLEVRPIGANAIVACVLGSDSPANILPSCGVAIQGEGQVISGSVEFEITEGYTYGDWLCFLCDDANGTIFGAKGPLVSGPECKSLLLDSLKLALAAGADASRAVEAAFQSVAFLSTTQTSITGTRQIEFCVSLSTAKQPAIQLTGCIVVMVVQPALEPFRDAQPFVERAPPVALFSHFRMRNPFADLTSKSQFEISNAQAFLAQGFKGPNRILLAAENHVPGNDFQRHLNVKYSVAVGRRCLTCSQPRVAQKAVLYGLLPNQLAEAGTRNAGTEAFFGDVQVEVELKKVQAEDRLTVSRNPESQSGETCRWEISDDGTTAKLRTLTKNVSREAITVCLQRVFFTTTAVPLDESPRRVCYRVSCPNLQVPLSWSSAREISIVTAPHFVNVAASNTDRLYRTHSNGVSELSLDAPSLWFATGITVHDPLKTKFRGKAIFSLSCASSHQSHQDAALDLKAPPHLAEHGKLSVSRSDATEPSDVKGLSQANANLDTSGTVMYGNSIVATYRLKDRHTVVEIELTSCATDEAAAAVLQSAIFFTSDASPGIRRSISLVASFGREHENRIEFSVTTDRPIVAIERLGRLMWTEHQGPVVATSHFGLHGTQDGQITPPPEALLHVHLLRGFEKGDTLAMNVGQKVPVEIGSLALYFGGLDVGRRVTHYTLLDNGLIVAFYLDDDSLLIRVSSDTNSPFRATLQRPPVLLQTPELINKALSYVTYQHTSIAPTVFKKVLCIRSEDSDGTYSDACIPLDVVPIDDPTQLDNLPLVSLFCQGSIEAINGFRLADRAILVDPDTEDFIGGYLSFSPACGSYVSSKDNVYVLSPAQQHLIGPDSPIVFIDDRCRLHYFASYEEYINSYCPSLRADILDGSAADDGLVGEVLPKSLQYCIGVVRQSELSSMLSSQSPSTAGALSPRKGKNAALELTSGPSHIPLRWVFHFKPPRPRKITLNMVQQVLRSIAFDNISGRVVTRRRKFTIQLRAGALSENASKVEGAQIADKTSVSFSLKILTGVFFVPAMFAEVPYQRNSGPQQVLKSVVILPLSPLVKIHKGRFIAQISEDIPLTESARVKQQQLVDSESEYISLSLRHDTGLEQRGDKLVDSRSSVLGTFVSVTKTSIEIAFNAAERIDAKQLQALTRSLTYNNNGVSKSAVPGGATGVTVRVIEVLLADSLHPLPGSLRFSSDDEDLGTDINIPTNSRPQRSHHFDEPCTFAARVRVLVKPEDSAVAGTLRSQAPFSIEAPAKPIEYTMRCGTARLFGGVSTVVKLSDDARPPPLLFSPSTLVIWAPPGVTAPLSIAEDAVIRTMPLRMTHQMTYALPRFRAQNENSGDASSLNSDPTQKELQYKGCAVAILTQACRSRNALTLEFLSCPPEIVGEVIRRVTFSGGGRRDKPGVKHLFKFCFKSSPDDPAEEVWSLGVTVTPPFVEELLGPPLQFFGPAFCPFAAVRVKQAAFSGGRLAVDLTADTLKSQLISDSDRLYLRSVEPFVVVFTDADEETGHVILSLGTSHSVLGTFSLTKTSLTLRLSSEPSVASGENIQTFLRTCLGVGQAPFDVKNTGQTFNTAASFMCTLVLEDAFQTSCETAVEVRCSLPKKVAKKKAAGEGPAKTS